MRKNDPRHLARVISIQKLFQIEFHQKTEGKTDPSDYSEKELAEINEFQNFDTKLIDTFVNGVLNSRVKADRTIKKFAKEWPIEQINTVDLQILRLAIYEGFIAKITPEKVAINEAIELARELGNEANAKFVNGVLGNLIDSNTK